MALELPELKVAYKVIFKTPSLREVDADLLAGWLFPLETRQRTLNIANHNGRTLPFFCTGCFTKFAMVPTGAVRHGCHVCMIDRTMESPLHARLNLWMQVAQDPDYAILIALYNMIEDGEQYEQD